MRRKRGFTLPELLLATAILSFTLCAMLLLFINCSLLNAASRSLSIAATHAQFVMEGIKNEIENTSLENIRISITEGNWNWDTATITNNGLAPLTNESIVTAASGTDPLQVTVTAAWDDRIRQRRSYLLTTLFTNQ